MADNIAAGVGRAKPSKVLKDFFAEVKVGFLEETFELRGHKWTMRTPTPDEEAWADRFVQTDSTMSFMSTQRITRLAVVIKAIDGTLLDALFDYPDDMTAADKKVLEEPDRKRYWLYAQLMASLSTDIPPQVLRELWEKYETLTKRQDEALKEATELGPNS